MKSFLSLALDVETESPAAGGPAQQESPAGARDGHVVLKARGNGHAGAIPTRRAERSSTRGGGTPFGPDVVLPEQFFERSSALEHATGERALMLAVLEDGIRCFREHLKNPRVRPRLLARQAERWIRSKDWDWPFSFNNVCESLELNPECLRARLLAPRDEGAPPAKPRSSHRVYRLTPRVKPPRRR